MPKISIIVPVYKVEKYIHKCVNSILVQTFTDFELILVDDGSPDNCGRICDEYASKDNRIKVIHKKNGGLSDSRNAGLNIASGEYVGFVDSDDYIENDMYQKLINVCNSNEVDISMCGRYDVSINNEIKSRFSFDGQKIWSGKEAIGNLLTWNDIDSSACDKLFKRDIFEELRFPVGKYNEDIYIMVNVLDKINKIVHIGESKYYYFHRPNSITTKDFSEKNMDMLEASDKVLKYVMKKYPDLKAKAESFYYKNIIYLLTLLLDASNKDDNLQSYKKLKKILNNNIILILSNQYIDLRNKGYLLLMITNTFSAIRKIKKIMEV